MKPSRRLLLICFAALISVATAQEAPLTAAQIVANLASKNAQRAARLRGYESTRHYEVDYRGFPGGRHATMTVRVTLAAPKKQFQIVSEDGSKLLLDRVLHRLIETEKEADNDQDRAATALSAENYDFKLIGVETLPPPATADTPPAPPKPSDNMPAPGRVEPGLSPASSAANSNGASAPERRCYVLQVIPKRNHKLLYRGKIWVDAEDFAVARIAAAPAKNPSFWISSTEIEHQYGKHGEFWLPATNRSVTKVRLGGRATLTINYGEYENIRAE